jgi:polar amino acid transport system substrate-binding protein
MNKTTRTAAGLLAASALIAACGGDETDSSALGLVEDGTLTVCTDVPYAPMEFEDPDSPSGYDGFDVDLMEAVADDLGLEIAFVVPGWDAITSGLAMETGRCDVAASSITITEEREEGVDFSEPYFTAEQSLLVPVDGASAAAEVANVGVQSGTTGEIFAQDNLSGDVTGFEAPGDMYLALEAGQVDGVLADLVANQGYADENDGSFTVIETYPTNEEYGLAVKEEGSEDLLDAINASLTTLRDDGTYDDIFATWFGA